MAEKIVSTQITDHVDGQPAIVLSNGNWGVFDPKTNMYKDNGIKASPEDDATAIKYYKLGNTSTPLEAPTRAGGWDSLTTLNASLAQADWDEDPLTTSKTNKFCWIAFYGKENVVDVSATESAGHLIFKPKYTRTKVSLWSNYADSPTISVVGNEIIITNPDGTVVKQKFATTEAIADIANLIASLQEQMDGSVYSYSLEGEPSMTKAPVTTWINGVDPSLIADIYSQHVGDTYTDLLTYVSYRFALIQGSASDPSNYGWKVIEDSALTNALGEIARLGREKVTIFTETPTAYSKGDMWLQPDNTMKIAIASRETFSEGDWLQPYATKSEVSDIREDLTAAQADATAAKNQIGELVLGLTTMDGAVADAIKDSIISDTEHMNLTAELKQLNVDQESLNATVAYLLASTYLPTTPKNALVAKKELLLGANGTSGSMGAYRTAISTMIADRVITAPERTAYNNAFSTYKTHLKDFNTAISNARQAIDAELKRLADEKVDNIEIGGRNLIYGEFVNGSWYQGSIGNNSEGNYGRTKEVLPIEPDTTYIFSMKDGTQLHTTRTAWLTFRNDANEWVGMEIFTKNKTVFKTPLTATKFTFSYNASSYTASVGGVATKARLPQIQKGTKATDWTPAPEDVQAEIDGVSSSLTTLVGTTKDALEDGIIDKTERAKITELDRALDIEQERMSSTVWAIKENPNLDMITEGLLNKASDDVLKDDTGSIDKLQAQLQIILAKTKVTEADKNSYTALYNTFKTTMKALEIAIINAQEAISKNSIDNIEIGGANLLSGLNREYYLNNTGTSITSIIAKDFNFKRNSEYVISYDIKGVGLTSFGVSMYTSPISTIASDGQTGSDAGGTIISPLTDEWKRVWIKIKTADWPDEEYSKRINISARANSEVSIRDIMFVSGNKAFDWSPAPEDVQAEIDLGVATVTTLYKNADEGATVDKPTADNEVSQGWSEASPDKVDGQVIWSVNRVTLKNGTKVYSNPANIQGADGEGGINVMITRQGSFRTYWRQIGDQNQILTTPEKVSEIIGGVEIGDVKYVQCKVLIYKGSVDVTASALADPTTQGKWFLNNVWMASNTDTLNIPIKSGDITYADGVDDEVRFEYTDTNAKNWKGATV